MVATQLIFVSGKGGTGKSALVAAIALQRARLGETVLAIDMGGGPGLAAHFGTSSLGYAPTEQRDGVYALSIDRSAALDEYLRLQLKIPRGAPTRQISNALSVLAETAPGVREIISIGKPMFEMWKGVWDTIVVDAPSLGQFQSYLRAPRTITDLVPTGNVRRQAEQLEQSLTDASTTSFVFVATPAELPIRETIESLDLVRREGLGSEPLVVLNRVVDPSGIEAGQLDLLPDGPVRAAAALQVHIEHDQAQWTSAIEHRLTLPYLRGVRTPLEVALQLSDTVGGLP